MKSFKVRYVVETGTRDGMYQFSLEMNSSSLVTKLVLLSDFYRYFNFYCWTLHNRQYLIDIWHSCFWISSFCFVLPASAASNFFYQNILKWRLRKLNCQLFNVPQNRFLSKTSSAVYFIFLFQWILRLF